MKNWWKNEVVYQIYPKSFKDSNNDGIGDLQGIIEKLDYLKELGITMIWICPIFSSPMIDNGYDISDFKGIDTQFGTMSDFNKLVKKAKDKNIKIILDLVINHTSDEHPWFQSAIKSKESKYRNYYIFKKSENDNPPNNWRSIFGGSVWEKSGDEYYFHSFHKKQPDLNWENPELRFEIYEMINWWLNKGISGFRIDSITFIKKDLDFGSLEPDGNDGLVTCKHKTRNRPGIEIFLNELKKETFDKFNAVTVGEAPGVNYDEFNKFIGEDGYFSMIFDFKWADIDVESGSDWFKRTNWNVKELKDKIFKSQLEIQKYGWSSNFIENHDQPRSLSKFIRNEKFQNSYSSKLLAILLLMLKGVPFIYQGQELGIKNFKRNSIKDFNDISSIDNFKRSIQEGFTENEALFFVNQRSRDNTRTPMLWDRTEYRGFSNVRPWIMISNNNDEIQADGNEVYEFYKKLIDLRQNSSYSEVITEGYFKPIENVPESIIAFERTNEKLRLEVYLNLSDQEQSIEIKANKWNLLLTNEVNWNEILNETRLKPYQGIILEVKNEGN